MEKKNILLIDNEKGIILNAKNALEKLGYSVFLANNDKTALKLLKNEHIYIVILDISLSNINGLEFLNLIKDHYKDIQVIVTGAYSDMQTTIKVMRMGAYDFLFKPFKLSKLVDVVNRAFKSLQAVKKRDVTKLIDNRCIIERSDNMHRIYKLIGRVAATDVTILITGESGVGKEIIARAIHENSNRADKCFLAVNCTAIPANLIESELFGHERGAFTGAQQSRIGKFEMANGGTLFLDEIGDMDHNLQAKLLRVIQEREIVRVGGNVPKKVDIRIIAATNKDLLQAIKRGEFREDLYHRLRVVEIHIPPLRERKVDIPGLVDYFVKEFQIKGKTIVKEISKGAMEKIMEYDWPGNIRELKNVIESALTLSQDPVLLPEHINLPEIIELNNNINLNSLIRKTTRQFLKDNQKDIYNKIISIVERIVIEETLKFNNENQVKTAKVLGINRNTLRSKIEKYELLKERGV